jgi:hypothetical protein
MMVAPTPSERGISRLAPSRMLLRKDEGNHTQSAQDEGARPKSVLKMMISRSVAGKAEWRLSGGTCRERPFVSGGSGPGQMTGRNVRAMAADNLMKIMPWQSGL